MKYLFSDFVLNSEKKELQFKNEIVTLTKQNYKLLELFVSNQGCLYTKDELIEKVWNSRVIADNSIDQSIYKLKKILSKYKDDKYFAAVYGKGTQFLPTVIIQSENNKNKTSNQIFTSKNILLFAILLFSSLLAGYYIIKNINKSSEKTQPQKSLLMVLPNTNDNKTDWLTSSSSTLIEKYLSYSNAVTLKSYQDKPRFLNKEQYLETQWKISPDLNTVSIDISFDKNLFTVTMATTNKQQHVSKHLFQNQNLNAALVQSTDWLNIHINDLNYKSNIIPEDSHVLELYMRGLSALNDKEYEKSINYFELCLKENPDYHLAALDLAYVMDVQGDQQRAHALLDSVILISRSNTIKIQANNIQGGIYMRQGKPEQTLKIYKDLLAKYKYNDYPILKSTHFSLSALYRTLSKNELALEEINLLESLVEDSQNYKFIADIYQFKGSLLLRMGMTQEAKEYANKGLNLFNKIADLEGVAKTHSVIARILKQQSEYKNALEHLNQSLNITRNLGIKFGIGATLNEIIEILIIHGELDKAWEYNQELQNIAIEIDFNAMLLASKIHTISIATSQKQWTTAELTLKEHQQLATAANNQRALIENKLLALELKLDQHILTDVLPLVNEIQTYIKQSKENSMQPHLNIMLSRYYFLNNEIQESVQLLQSSLILANSLEAGDSVTRINNLLAEIYLHENDATKALSVLEQSLKYNPVPYPYLLLKSKAYMRLNQQTQALEFALLCKRSANELWEIEDEKFLTNIIGSKQEGIK